MPSILAEKCLLKYTGVGGGVGGGGGGSEEGGGGGAVLRL